MAAMLLVDAILLPSLVRERICARLRSERTRRLRSSFPTWPHIGTHEDPTLASAHAVVTDTIEWVNMRVGEFVAYWAVISVFGYYYEVIARFVFNSPTNWLHESMFLMYGMQYMLAGAYAYQVRPACARRRLLRQVLDARQRRSPTSSRRCSSLSSSSRC